MNKKHLVASVCLSSILTGSFYTLPVKADQVCLESSIENMNLEIDLVDQINRIKLNSEIQVQEIDRIEREIIAYSDNIDQASEVIQKVAGWDRTIAGILNTVITDYVDLPGIDVDIEQTEGRLINLSPAGALIDLSGLLDTFTPSNLADWITETSLSLAESRLAITSSSAEASLLLSRQLRQLRATCEEERLEQEASNRPVEEPENVQPPTETTVNEDEPYINERSRIDEPDMPEEIAFNPFTGDQFVTATAISLLSNDDAFLQEVRSEFLNRLNSTPTCSTFFDVTQLDTETAMTIFGRSAVNESLNTPAKMLFMFSVLPNTQIPMIWEPFQGRIVDQRISHDDNLQTQYEINFLIPAYEAGAASESTSASFGSVGFTFFKNRDNYNYAQSPEMLRQMFYQSIGFMGTTNGFVAIPSATQCNF